MIVFETERLKLRHMTTDDFDALMAVFGDPVTMKYYPSAFQRDDVKKWIEWCMKSYDENGYGLYAMVLRETDTVIGDCGHSRQEVDGEAEIEIGYHVLREHWRKAARQRPRAERRARLAGLSWLAICSPFPVNFRVQNRRVFVGRFVRALSAGAVVFVMVATSTTRTCAEQNMDATAGSNRAAEISRQNSAQAASQGTEDWLERVKKSVAAHDLKAALQAAEARLTATPEDSDAMGWRAQILAWIGQRKDAEAAYRKALQLSPKDGDFLLGLATLLAQDGRNEDALALLDEAMKIPPMRADVLNERGRVLRALGRRDEARAAFLQAEALEPRNISVADDEARAGLRSLDGPPRFEIDIGNETDTFNYTGSANTQMITFVAKPNTRWIFSTEADTYQRFGAAAGKLIGSATYRLTPSDAFTVGGGGGNAQGIIPRAETYFAYGHGFRISETKAIRGIEATYNQHWFWYEQAGVVVFSGTVATNFAHDFRWTMAGNAARSRFTGAAVAWEPSGYGRVDFPAPRVAASRLLLNLTFAVGSENFSEVDQVGAFASRTYAGGFRVGLTERNYVNFYVARQERNGGNSETSYGVSYGLRF